MNTKLSCLAAAVLLFASAPAGAQMIYESAALGPAGVLNGSVIDDSQFLGVKFELTSQVTTARIGGHFAFDGPIFGAVVALDGVADFPDSADLSTPDVLGVALLSLPGPSDEVSADLALTLEPGWYALVFGSGLFGATGWGVATDNNLDLGAPAYFFRDPFQGFDWFDLPPDQGMRFFVSGSGSGTPAAPDIDVAPPSVDFGSVNVADSSATILTIANTGTLDLNVTGLGFAVSSGDFRVTDPSLVPAMLPPGASLDVGVEFAPSAPGLVSAELDVLSDDPDEPLVAVTLVGEGAVGEGSDQASALEQAIQEAVAAGTLTGSGKGKSADGRLQAFLNMVEATVDLIEGGFIEDACGQLEQLLRRTDGSPQPPDFVEGEDAETIAAYIEFLMMTLECGG